jgi:hypothetical protein
MTQDEIIKMAWDSGAYTHRLTMWGFSLEDLERFAKLVAAKRTWVGLTEEDRAEILSRKWWDFEDEFDVDGFLRLAEAKLKEKNNG